MAVCGVPKHGPVQMIISILEVLIGRFAVHDVRIFCGLDKLTRNVKYSWNTSFDKIMLRNEFYAVREVYCRDYSTVECPGWRGAIKRLNTEHRAHG